MSDLEKTVPAQTASINPKHLSALREAKSLSVSDISQRTRLSLKQVDLLESGQFSALPGSAFVMGALRSYCKVLGVEPEPYLQDAKSAYATAAGQDLPTPDRLHTSMPSRNAGGLENSSSRIWWVASCLLGVVAIGLYYANPAGLAGLIKKQPVVAPVTSDPVISSASSTSPSSASPSTVVETVQPVVNVIPAVPGNGASGAQSGQAGNTSTATGSTSATGATLPAAGATLSQSGSATSAMPASPTTGSGPALANAPVANAPVSPSVASPSASTVNDTPSSTAGKKIEFAFSRDAWVEVKDSGGKSLVNRLFKAGSKENIDVAGPVSVVVGSASGVTLNWSGGPFDMKPFVKDDVARFSLK